MACIHIILESFLFCFINIYYQDLLIGGSESFARTMELAMSELLKQPHLIRKATKELDRVVGKDRWVEEKHIPQLPYIDAIMKETMRKNTTALMLVPRLALEDCNIAGYDIHKGSIVLINLWCMGRDPSIWDAPKEFRPERFLGKAIDVTRQNFELLPFGSGRRMCPGYSLGLKMISSTLANMLHGFQWNFLANMKPEDLSTDEVPRACCGPKAKTPTSSLLICVCLYFGILITS